MFHLDNIFLHTSVALVIVNLSSWYNQVYWVLQVAALEMTHIISCFFKEKLKVLLKMRVKTIFIGHDQSQTKCYNC